MKIALLILILTITGCGSDNSKGSDQSAVATNVEVTRVTITPYDCTAAICGATIRGEANGPTGLSDDDNVTWTLVLGASDTDAKPVCDGERSQSMGMFNRIDVAPGFVIGHTYHFHVCAFNRMTGKYSEGITKDFTF